MRVEPELPDHPKYLRLKRRVGDYAMEALIRLWGHCQQNGRGELWRGVDAEYLELIAKWNEGEPGLLFRSLLETGWIVQTEEGIFIHDWEEMNKQIVGNWKNGPKGGRPKKTALSEDRNPLETQRLTQSEKVPGDGLRAISGRDPNNPVVNPIQVSVNPVQTHREPYQRNVTERNVTEHNETNLNKTNGEVRQDAGRTLRYDLAEQVIDFLNQRTGAEFKGTKLELDLTAMCLAKVGNDVEGVKKMVARQVALWAGTPRLAACLQPRTLFEPDKFEGYYAMRLLPTDVTDPASRRRELEELIQKHPANKASSYHKPDVAEERKEELRGLRQELAELSKKTAAQKAGSPNV